MRKHAPRTARTADVKDGIDNLAHVDRPGTPARFCFRDSGFDASPLWIGQIARVRERGHGRSLRERETEQQDVEETI
jgi:hypothetical protein